MKRVLLLVLALAAASAVGAAAASSPSVKAEIAARKQAATLTARELLHEFVPPPRSTRLAGWPSDYGFHSRTPNTAIVGELVDVHAFWISHGSVRSIASFERSRGPAGYSTPDGVATNSDGSYSQFSFNSPPRGATARRLVVTISQRHARTIVRVDAQVVWVYPRSPQERVPVGATEIDVKAPKMSRAVTDPAKVRQIVYWFDALPISPPGVAVMCPAVTYARIQFVFRSASGERLASATAPAGRASVCAQIGFSIHGKQQTPLIDHLRGESFALRLQGLLGVRLTGR